MGTTSYGMRIKTALEFDDAVAAITLALSEQGFGILTRIDVKETLEAKLGVDFRPYVILGACNPTLAHRGLEAEIDLGLLLPCNVIVYAEPDGAVVSVIDPALMARVTENPRMHEIAVEARSRLERALNALDAQPG